MKTNYYIMNNRKRRMRKRAAFRKRCISLLVMIVLAISVFGVCNAFGETHVKTETVVVKSGSTLWSIASDVDSNKDIRELVYEIQELNEIKGNSIYAGQVIEIPIC